MLLRHNHHVPPTTHISRKRDEHFIVFMNHMGVANFMVANGTHETNRRSTFGNDSRERFVAGNELRHGKIHLSAFSIVTPV